MRYTFMRYPGGKVKAITFSYDDGCGEDRRFCDILSDHGLKATFNFCNMERTRKNGITTQDVKDFFLGRGHEIATHGYEHIAPGIGRPIEVIQDIINCRLHLESEFGMIIRGMAYPDSGITRFDGDNSYAVVREYLKDLDIAYVRTLLGDNDLFRLPNDWYAWMPTAHHDNPQFFEYADKFLNMDVLNASDSRRQSRLFYVWGHSYEFEMKKNWDRAEKMCDALGGHDDVWYATNIEIYDYATAYNSLIYSADGKRVYNPTLVEIWFEAGKKNYMIAPGQTLILG